MAAWIVGSHKHRGIRSPVVRSATYKVQPFGQSGTLAFVPMGAGK